MCVFASKLHQIGMLSVSGSAKPRHENVSVCIYLFRIETRRGISCCFRYVYCSLQNRCERQTRDSCTDMPTYSVREQAPKLLDNMALEYPNMVIP